jgi:hypothetical protein
MHGKGKNVNTGSMQFINHESNYSLGPLRHHADTVSLSQASDEFIFRPRKLETLVLDPQHGRHVSPDHPTNVDI